MRQETNKEIDLLLRRLSGRDGEAARDAETQMDDRHLDADELSSYAQNVAPPKARARYTAHLAECSACRRLATELSLALGVPTTATSVETVPVAGGLKTFLANLFSPLVLRYAVPALGVIVVMVIGFVVLRQREQRAAFIAQSDAQSPAAAKYVEQPPATPARPSFDDYQQEQRAGAQAGNEATQQRESGPGGTAGDVKSGERQESKTTGTGDTAAAAPVTVASPETVHSYSPRVVSELPLMSPTPPAAPLKPGIATDGDTGETRAKKESVAKQAAKPAATTAEVQAANEKEQANEPPREAAARSAKSVASDRAYHTRPTPDPNATTMAGAGGRGDSRRRDEESKDEAETRSIAGRKFRRQGGIWTDTAYDSATRTVNMARGSEQFRGLVADEPAIGKIAEQLDGEVIVVWKGRAYRIR